MQIAASTPNGLRQYSSGLRTEATIYASTSTDDESEVREFSDRTQAHVQSDETRSATAPPNYSTHRDIELIIYSPTLKMNWPCDSQRGTNDAQERSRAK